MLGSAVQLYFCTFGHFVALNSIPFVSLSISMKSFSFFYDFCIHERLKHETKIEDEASTLICITFSCIVRTIPTFNG